MAEASAPMHANAPGAEAIFSVVVTVRGDVSLEVLDLLAGDLEAQGEILGRLFNETLDAFRERARVEVNLYDPQHPTDDCQCTGPEGWHCAGEESQHWAQPDGSCGHCGWEPEP